MNGHPVVFFVHCMINKGSSIFQESLQFLQDPPEQPIDSARSSSSVGQEPANVLRGLNQSGSSRMVDGLELR